MTINFAKKRVVLSLLYVHYFLSILGPDLISEVDLLYCVYSKQSLYYQQDEKGWVYHLFVYVYWRYRVATLMYCYHSIAPSTYKDDISVIAIVIFGFLA